MDSVSRQLLMSNSPTIVSGQAVYTTPGTYSWVCPTGVTSVSVVCVGAGGGNYVGGGTDGGLSRFGTQVIANGGKTSNGSSGGAGGTVGAGTGFAGGAGGTSGSSGGGGAGGYAGAGGAGGSGTSNGTAGTGGAAGGGAGNTNVSTLGYGGGGVGLLGQGDSGSGGIYGYGYPYGNGGGGSGGSTGLGSEGGPYGGGSGGANSFGAGGGGALAYANNISVTPGSSYTVVVGAGGTWNGGQRIGANGAVRIIWPGDLRQFPSTNTGDI